MNEHTRGRSYLIEIHDGSEAVTYPLVKSKGTQGLIPDPFADCKSSSELTQVNLKKHSPFSKKFRQNMTSEDAQKAIHYLLELPSLVPDESFVAQAMMLSFAAKINDKLNDSPAATPMIQLGAVKALPSVLPIVFEALQGPPVWEGVNWSLRRPWILCIQTGKFASVPSTSPMDYVGGKMRFRKKKVRFWLPYCNAVFALQPSVPTGVIREIIEHSALALPLLCGQNFSLNRPEIRLDAGNAYALDIKQAEVVKRSIGKIFWVIDSFDRFIRAKKKRVRRVLHSAERYLPKFQTERFTQVSQDPKDRTLALGLSVFESFLKYAVKNGWISESDHESILQHFWSLTFPGSQPADESLTAPDAWKSPDCFWRFLAEYLTGATVASPEEMRSAETGAAVVRIKDTYLLIVPKASVSYAKWLEDEGMAGPVQGNSWETALFHDLLDAGIILKAEKARDPWRYAFVNGIPGKKAKEICYGIALAHLPKSVLTVLRVKFGAKLDRWVPNLSSDGSREGGEV